MRSASLRRAGCAVLLLLLASFLPPSAAADEPKPKAAPADSPKPPAAPPDEKPMAAFPTFTHDFGEVSRGQELKHTFVVKNDGKVDLQILNVAPT